MIRQILGEVSVPVANTAYKLSRAACCCDCDTAYWY